MNPRRFLRPRRSRPAGQVTAVPPAAWFEVTYAIPGRCPDPVRVAAEGAALAAARRMSAQGDPVDVTLVLDTGRRLVVTYAGGQPLPGAAARVPAAADAACRPDPRLRGTGRCPGGISPLPVAATSGGPLRPRRLLYPDGTPLACRPAGRAGPSWTGIAAGVVPASGPQAPGWLQAVRLGPDAPASLVMVHPALVSPRDVDPYGWLRVRDRYRFGEFDAAEAAGRIAAWLPAVLVDAGDFITTVQGDIFQVTLAAPDAGPCGVRVAIIADGLAGGTGVWNHQAHELVEVMIPDSHPADRGPDARRLFAPPRPAVTVRVPRPAVLRDRR
ncbi:MAG: hypothetical protein ACRDOL_29165 [Streptosporangiaceae bacterium]